MEYDRFLDQTEPVGSVAISYPFVSAELMPTMLEFPKAYGYVLDSLHQVDHQVIK